MIFENVANGVPIEAIMTEFRRSRLEVQQEVEFVAKKIREYNFTRLANASPFGAPPAPCGTYAEIRLYRKNLLHTLSKIGPITLSSPLLIPNISIQKVDSADAVREISHRVNNS